MSEQLQHTIQTSVTNQFGKSYELLADLRYDVSKPYFVQLNFHNSTGPFTFSRNFVTCGLITDVTEGVVQMYPHPVDPELVSLVLDADAGMFFVRVNRIEIEDFIDDTYELMPEGEELDIAMLAVEAFLGAKS